MNEIEELRQQLAASQAREEELRGMLVTAMVIIGHPDDDFSKLLSSTVALPKDTTALETMIQQAGEVMRERCAKHLEDNAKALAEDYGSDDLGSLSFGSGAAADIRMDAFSSWLEDAEAIRSLPAVTLKDLMK